MMHRYSKTEKLNARSWSLNATDCITGSRLRAIPGTTCSKCYARRGRYNMPTVRSPRDINRDNWLEARRTPEGRALWVQLHVEALQDDTLFRWFDSGDLQGVDMLLAIAEVARRTPWVRHWLPTHERAIVLAAITRFGLKVPHNLVIRVSADLLGSYEPFNPPGYGAMHTSSVESGHGEPCRAIAGKCGDCRLCWDPGTRNIDYARI